MTHVAALQMTSCANVARNLAVAGELLRQARAQGAVVAVLPENFAYMGRGEADKLALAEAHGSGPIQAFLAEQARMHGLWIVGGTIPLKLHDEPRVAAARFTSTTWRLAVAAAAAAAASRRSPSTRQA